MDNLAFQTPADPAYNPLKLFLALERNGTTLAFRARWRVATIPELILYLDCLVALGSAVEHAEEEPDVNRSEVA